MGANQKKDSMTKQIAWRHGQQNCLVMRHMIVSLSKLGWITMTNFCQLVSPIAAKLYI